MTKDELIEEHRHWNVEHIDWWDSTYDMFKEDMRAKGIEVDKMYFSGFWSQGDGACFEGSVSDWEVFLKSLGYDNPVLIEHAKQHWSFSVEHSGHYCHENCTSFSDTMPNPSWYYSEEEFINLHSPYPEGDFRSAVWFAALSGFDYISMANEFTEALKDHMRQLYKNLEANYDYLTSDEVVWESLEANDMTDEIDTPQLQENLA